MKISRIIILVLAVTLFSGCGLLGYDEEISKIVKSGNPEDCASLEGEDAKKTKTRIEKCYDSYAQEQEMPEVCSKIEEKFKHDNCFEKLAEKTENLELCEKLKGDSDDCISKIGIAKNDESICAKLDKGAARDKCNQAIGKNKKSIEICELIETARYKDACLEPIALEKKDVSICEKLSRYNKDGCIQQIAISTKDVSLCEKSSRKESCIERAKAVIGQNAEEANDSDLENDLEDEDLDDEIMDELEDETTKAGVNLVDGKLYINSSPGEVLKITSSDLPGWASSEMVVVGAMAVCVGPPSIITTGANDVILNGLPVARINDQTSHGGSIVVGSDKIFINGTPATFVGAQTVCPMVTGVVPHVGGPISNNGY